MTHRLYVCVRLNVYVSSRTCTVRLTHMRMCTGPLMLTSFCIDTQEYRTTYKYVLHMLLACVSVYIFTHKGKFATLRHSLQWRSSWQPAHPLNLQLFHGNFSRSTHIIALMVFVLSPIGRLTTCYRRQRYKAHYFIYRIFVGAVGNDIINTWSCQICQTIRT